MTVENNTAGGLGGALAGGAGSGVSLAAPGLRDRAGAGQEEARARAEARGKAAGMYTGDATQAAGGTARSDAGVVLAGGREGEWGSGAVGALAGMLPAYRGRGQDGGEAPKQRWACNAPAGMGASLVAPSGIASRAKLPLPSSGAGGEGKRV